MAVRPMTDVIFLKKRMVELGIRNMTELSKRSGINRNTLSQVLNGRIRPSSGTMNKLIHALFLTSAEAGMVFFPGGRRFRSGVWRFIVRGLIRCPCCGTLLNRLKNEQHYFCPQCLKEYTRSLNIVDPDTGKSPRQKAYQKRGWTCALCGKRPGGKKYSIKWMKLCEGCYWELLTLVLLRSFRDGGDFSCPTES